LQFNIVNGKVADESINVADTLAIGQAMTHSFKESLPEGFHNPIKKKVKTLEALKKGVKIECKTAYDIEALFSCLLVLGQMQNISLEAIFADKLCRVPPAAYDKNGFLRKGNKSSCRATRHHMQAKRARHGDCGCARASIPQCLALWRYRLNYSCKYEQMTLAIQPDCKCAHYLQPVSWYLP